MQSKEEKRERHVRRLAAKSGYVVRKSRVRSINLDNFGNYMLLDTKGIYVVRGSRFDATLDDLLVFFSA